MKPSEVADLLSLSVELDRFSTADKMTPEKVVAWAAVFAQEAPGMTFAEAQPLVIKFYGTAGESLTPFALIELWKRSRRLVPAQIEADVRVAKAIGLIPADHPPRGALPASVARELSEYRQRVNRTLLPPEIGPVSNTSPLRLEVGKRVPR